MYTYVFNITSDFNESDDLTIDKVRGLFGFSGTVTEKRWNEFEENPLEEVKLISDINEVSNGYEFVLTKDAIINYLSAQYTEWMNLANTVTKEDFFSYGSNKMGRISRLYNDKTGDAFIILTDGKYHALSFNELLREGLALCKKSDIDKIKWYAKNVFVYHS